MNDAQIRRALANQNLIQVSEATKIAPNILERIIDGKHIPDPDQIDALAGWFGGEYYMSGTDFNWKRNKKVITVPETLSTIVDTIDPTTLPQREFSPWAPISDYPPLPSLKPGPKPTGNGAGPNNQGITGTGRPIR